MLLLIGTILIGQGDEVNDYYGVQLSMAYDVFSLCWVDLIEAEELLAAVVDGI